MWAGALASVLLLASPATQTALFPIRQGGLYGFVDRSGAVVVAPRFEHTVDSAPGCPPFSEGLQSVKDGDKWGYVDSTGTLAIPARFLSAACFHEGLAAVSDLSKDAMGATRVRSGYIDRRGQWVIEPRFNSARDFSEGLA